MRAVGFSLVGELGKRMRSAALPNKAFAFALLLMLSPKTGTKIITLAGDSPCVYRRG